MIGDKERNVIVAIVGGLALFLAVTFGMIVAAHAADLALPPPLRSFRDTQHIQRAPVIDHGLPAGWTCDRVRLAERTLDEDRKRELLLGLEAPVINAIRRCLSERKS